MAAIEVVPPLDLNDQFIFYARLIIWTVLDINHKFDQLLQEGRISTDHKAKLRDFFNEMAALSEEGKLCGSLAEQVAKEVEIHNKLSVMYEKLIIGDL